MSSHTLEHRVTSSCRDAEGLASTLPGTRHTHTEKHTDNLCVSNYDCLTLKPADSKQSSVSHTHTHSPPHTFTHTCITRHTHAQAHHTHMELSTQTYVQAHTPLEYIHTQKTSHTHKHTHKQTEPSRGRHGTARHQSCWPLEAKGGKHTDTEQTKHKRLCLKSGKRISDVISMNQHMQGFWVLV